jgi:hypothetical protein
MALRRRLPDSVTTTANNASEPAEPLAAVVVRQRLLPQCYPMDSIETLLAQKSLGLF